MVDSSEFSDGRAFGQPEHCYGDMAARRRVQSAESEFVVAECQTVATTIQPTD
jgi:hypothetical protein